MTPDVIKKATTTLAQGVADRTDAGVQGAALGRTLAAQIKARAVATDQMNKAAVAEIELALLQLAACRDELLAEIACSALRELHGG